MRMIAMWACAMGIALAGMSARGADQAAVPDGRHAVKMRHTPLADRFVAGKRIDVSLKASDPSGIKEVRCYFRAGGEGDYIFVRMPQVAKGTFDFFGGSVYRGTLPAPDPQTMRIEYLFVVVNRRKTVVRSQSFSMAQDSSKGTPDWQRQKDDREVEVFTELDKAPKEITGFRDDIHADTVESAARFGMVTEGIYVSHQIAAAGGAAGASGAASGGTVAAGSSAVSGAAVAGTAAAVAVGGGVAAASSGGGGGGGGGGSTEPSAEGDDVVDVSGSWSGSRDDGFGFTMSISQSGSSISGTIVDESGEGGSFSGSVEGNGLSATGHIQDNGHDVPLAFTASVNGNSMSGTARNTNSGKTWSFSASR